MIFTLLVLIVLLWSVTSRSRFWVWLATRNGGQLLLIIVILTLLVWAAVNIAGFGPK
jgi:hypothetical protein